MFNTYFGGGYSAAMIGLQVFHSLTLESCVFHANLGHRVAAVSIFGSGFTYDTGEFISIKNCEFTNNGVIQGDGVVFI